MWVHISIPMALSLFLRRPSPPHSLTPLLICSQILTLCSENHFRQPESEQFAYGLSKRSYHCMAHSYSWGHGKTGALIGPVKAQNPPLWSELTAIGWLFISNHIPVDPVANGYRFFLWLHVQCDSGPKTESGLKQGAAILLVRSSHKIYMSCSLRLKLITFTEPIHFNTHCLFFYNITWVVRSTVLMILSKSWKQLLLSLSSTTKTTESKFTIKIRQAR